MDPGFQQRFEVLLGLVNLGQPANFIRYAGKGPKMAERYRKGETPIPPELIDRLAVTAKSEVTPIIVYLRGLASLRLPLDEVRMVELRTDGTIRVFDRAPPTENGEEGNIEGTDAAKPKRKTA